MRSDDDAAVRAACDALRRRGREPFDFQVEAWRAYLAGESGLVSAPTGMGKTLAAWGGPLIDSMRPAPARDTGCGAGHPDAARARGLRLLWVTPLRALANDLAINLRDTAAALGADWRIDLRTGDTSSTRRRRQRTDPPDALVITPESLSVLMSDVQTHALLQGVTAIVVDEWHELLAGKRGVLLELCLAHLRALCPDLRIWGLSATLPRPEDAMAVLLGGAGRGRLVRGTSAKRIEVTSLLPDDVSRFPWSGHLGGQLLERVIGAIDAAGSTLVFTNTRSQAELWYQAIVGARLDWLEHVALHHGSIDRKVRGEIEARLRDGRLRCVVATSSLDLGVDFTPVDQVIQVGSPKGIARLTQRAGRSGHQPGGISRIACVPTHAWELIEIAASRVGVERSRLEHRAGLALCLDVLAQHAVTLAAGPGFAAGDLYAQARDTHAFAALTPAQWQWVLDFITRGGQALQGYPQFRRVVVSGGRHVIEDARIARRHRVSIGTITSDTSVQVRFRNGARLGTIEESFVGRLKPGDEFIFAGRLLALLRIREMTAYVEPARGRRRGQVPRWQGGRMPLSTELADLVLELLAEPAPEGSVHPEIRLAAPLLALQAQWSALPSEDRLLVEGHRSREGYHVYLFPFAGRQVHEGMAGLVAARWAGEFPQTFTLTANDYGFELLSPTPIDASPGRVRAALRTDDLAADLTACMNLSELAKRRFRDIARIAGLLDAGLPGAGKSSRQLQSSGGLLYDVLSTYDADNELLHQARREVLESQLEITELRAALQVLARREIVRVDPPRLTPLSFPLWAERLRGETLSTETWQQRVLRAAERLERLASDGR
jgi:ATP-dependent helicase Lhr and Lhr-like helicase